MAYVAVAGQTAGAVSVAEAMSNLLLQRILGSGPSVKYGLGSGLLAQAAAGVGGNCAASGVCQMYSDAGLIGALIVSEAASAGENLQRVNTCVLTPHYRRQGCWRRGVRPEVSQCDGGAGGRGQEAAAV